MLLRRLDWLGVTKLTPSAFADELAAFCGCDRVHAAIWWRAGSRERSSLRAFYGRAAFPYEDAWGVLTLAVATPPDAETVRAVEIALRGP